MNKLATKAGALPEGWRWVKLGEVCRVFTGSPAPQGKQYFNESGPFFFRVRDIGMHRRTICLRESQDKLSSDALNHCQLVLAKKGTVIFPKSGAAIATNNRALLAVDGYIVSHIIAIESREYVIPEWIYHVSCQLDMMFFSDNVGYPSLKKSVVDKIEIPLPPLAEQKLIAAILKEQMAAVENARAAAQTRLEAIKALPAAFLRQIFPQPDQPLPEGWRWVKLGEVCLTSSGGTPSRGNREYYRGSIPWIKSGELKDCPVISTEETITKRGLDSSSANIVPNGTLLIAMYGATVGRLGITGMKSATNQAVCAIFPDGDADKNFLFFYLFYIRKELIETSFGGAQPNISQSVIRNLQLPLPSLPEQKRIATTLKEQMEAVEKSSTAAEEELNTINAIPAALLRRAFSGEL